MKKKQDDKFSTEKIQVWHRHQCREGVGGRKRQRKTVEERWKVEQTVRGGKQARGLAEGESECTFAGPPCQSGHGPGSSVKACLVHRPRPDSRCCGCAAATHSPLVHSEVR